jgi:ribosomal-protein-alanine N-acetyltransferase
MIPNLESERLRLQKVGLQHKSEVYLSWMNDPVVYKYLESAGHYSMSQLEDYLDKAEKNESLCFWAIIRKDNGRHIGNIKIDPINLRHNRAEYGILLGDRDSWGMGFGREATEMVIKYSFEELNIRKITLGVVEDNLAAVKLYEKIGFVIEAKHKEHGIYAGKFCDTIRMALFRKDYMIT